MPVPCPCGEHCAKPGLTQFSIKLQNGRIPLVIDRRMRVLADGRFAVEADLAPGTHNRFRFAGGLAVADPASR